MSVCVKASKCRRCLLSELCRVIHIRPQETATVLKHGECTETNVVLIAGTFCRTHMEAQQNKHLQKCVILCPPTPAALR